MIAIFKTEEEAKETLKGLLGVQRRYGKVAVADLSALTGHSTTYWDEILGWNDVSNVGVIKDGDEFRLNLPEPESIK